MKSDSWLFRRRAARSSAVLLALSLSGVARAENRTPMREVLSAQLPKFDPSAETPKPVVKEDEVKNRATLIRLPASAMIPPAKVEPSLKSAAADEPAVVMPQVTVTGKSKPSPASSPLPRLNVRPPVKDLPEVPFETPSARAQRLVRKHLTAFDRLFLNRFTVPIFGVSPEARAAQLEREEATALAFNAVAEGIEWGFWTGQTPEEKKRMKDMYYDVLVARPK